MKFESKWLWQVSARKAYKICTRLLRIECNLFKYIFNNIRNHVFYCQTLKIVATHCQRRKNLSLETRNLKVVVKKHIRPLHTRQNSVF